MAFIYIFFEVFVARRIGHTGSRKQITIFDTKSSTFLALDLCLSNIILFVLGAVLGLIQYEDAPLPE